jgi:hypothetical protein
MVSFGCDEFHADRRRRSVPQVYVITSKLFLFTVSPGFVNLVVWALFTTYDIDCQPLEPSTTA